MLHHIARVPLFEGLPPGQIEDLAMIVTDQLFKKGETIFSEGEDGNGFYVVITGRVKIFKLSPEGKEQILHFFGPGEPFGEVPVFTGQQFPANAEGNLSLLPLTRSSSATLAARLPVPNTRMRRLNASLSASFRNTRRAAR